MKTAGPGEEKVLRQNDRLWTQTNESLPVHSNMDVELTTSPFESNSTSESRLCWALKVVAHILRTVSRKTGCPAKKKKRVRVVYAVNERKQTRAG